MRGRPWRAPAWTMPSLSPPEPPHFPVCLSRSWVPNPSLNIAGAIASDGASGSGSSQNDNQRNSHRLAAIGGPLVRNSTAQTLQENRTESSAIDPLSQVCPSLV